jgi:hypothetical protein
MYTCFILADLFKFKKAIPLRYCLIFISWDINQET